jgi:FKBP-type peptidyl-prolyl cis-trans isomerase FklB
MLFKKLILATGACALFLTSCDQNKTSATLNTEMDSVSYAIGLSIGNNFKQQSLDSVSVDLIAQAINDVLKDKKDLPMTEADVNMLLQSFMMKHQRTVAEKAKLEGVKNIEEGNAFLAKNKEKEGVVTLPSGLQYEVIKTGDGAKPTLEDMVTTHYHGTLIDGTVFDSSVDRGEPASFPVRGVIPAWTEALQLMNTGSKWKLYVPADLAYGDRPAGKIKAGSTLIFEVELISIGQAGGAHDDHDDHEGHNH